MPAQPGDIIVYKHVMDPGMGVPARVLACPSVALGALYRLEFLHTGMVGFSLTATMWRGILCFAGFVPVEPLC